MAGYGSQRTPSGVAEVVWSLEDVRELDEEYLIGGKTSRKLLRAV